MQTQKGEVENLIKGTFFVIVGVYPTGTGCFLAADVPLVKVVPIPDEGIFVEEEATIVDSRVALFLQFAQKLALENPFQLLVLFQTGQISHASRVVQQVVHLVNRPLSEIHLPKLLLSLSSLVQDQGLGRAAVAVKIPGFRVSDRPAFIFEIPQVQDVSFHDAPDRISLVVGAPDVMPFLANENVISSWNDLSGLGGLENVEEAFAGKRLHAGVPTG